MDLNLETAKVVVTGGSKGIGLACARSFAREGASVVLVSRDPARLGQAAEMLRKGGAVSVDTLAADLGAEAGREKLAAAHPDIDVLVNNAGAIPGGSILDLAVGQWVAAWQLKVFGYVHLTQLYLARMKERRRGTIVNIIGMAGQAPRWDYVCGAAGNAALIAMTRAVGARSVDWGVRVLGINPSATRTDRIVALSRARARDRFDDETRWQETLSDLPLGRLAEPDEIADLAVMLCSPRASYLSGTIVDVDGGQMYRGTP